MYPHSSSPDATARTTTRASLHRKATGLARMIIELHEGGLTPLELRFALAARFHAACEEATALARTLLQSALVSLHKMVRGRQRPMAKWKAEVNSQHLGQALGLLEATI
jgi:hypothetical protein